MTETTKPQGADEGGLRGGAQGVSEQRDHSTLSPPTTQETSGNSAEAQSSLQNIPDDLKASNQFVLWRYEQRDTPKPTKVPYNPSNGCHASVSDPTTWGTFEQCLQVLPVSGMDGLGFVLIPEANLVCIDLDHSDDPMDQARQMAISQSFDTYQEISPSGKGLHIWVKGSVPSGRRRSCVEIYPSRRFMTMTGNVYKQAPVREYPDELHQLWAELGPSPSSETQEAPVVDKEQSQSDDEIVATASGAVNGEKFLKLWQGEWQKYNYPSQSEADFALIDIIAYYTQNRCQITRMFRNSGLGKRKKALRADYCEKMVNRAFDNQPAPIDLSALKANMEQALAAKKSESVNQEQEQPVSSIYNPPPGLIGELAAFIYAAAPRPVPEIALAGAIGLMAGVCGRAYNISGTGLNQYTFLIAKTGRGKEAMSSGISKLIASLVDTVPDSKLFIGPSKIASPEALQKYLSNKSKSFLSIMGEFADTLKRMANDSRNVPQQGVKQLMLDLYNKSGKGAMLGSLIYSDKDKNTEAMLSPAFSILGEATPDKFYDLLDESMIAEGLLPRFSIIEYQGKRPPLNQNHHKAVISERLKEQLGQLAAHCLTLNNGNRVVDIDLSDESKALIKKFDHHCDHEINHGNGVMEELWNRAHIKALKLAGLLAIGTNYINPKVSLDQAQWAISFIESDIKNILKRFESGEIGSNTGEIEQYKAMVKVFKDYVTCDWSKIESYDTGSKNLHSDKVIPHSYISRRLRGMACFRTDNVGATNAIKRTIENLQTQGDIGKISQHEVRTKYNFNGQCYSITNPGTFLN